MPGLDPGISFSKDHCTWGEHVDGRDKPGHDVRGTTASFVLSFECDTRQRRLLVPVDVILADADADRHRPVFVGVGG